MSNLGTKVRPGNKTPLKPAGTPSRASSDLRKLQSLLAKSGSRREVVDLSHGEGGSSSRASRSSPKHSGKLRTESNTSSEAAELEKFSITYKDQRCFSNHPLDKLFSGILTTLIKNRLCSEWIDRAPPESIFRVIVCLRLLIRDPNYQITLHQLHGIDFLARYMESVATRYLSCGEQGLESQSLVTMTYIFQKLSAAENQRLWVIESGAHRSLVKLLYTRDSSVVQGALLALTALAQSPECGKEIGELPVVETLLVILQEHDLLSKKLGAVFFVLLVETPPTEVLKVFETNFSCRMSAELLRLLSPVPQVRSQVIELGGVPVLLSLLHGPHVKLLWAVTWVLVQLCEDPEARVEIRSWGGVQQLLRLLSSDRSHISDRRSIKEEPRPPEELDNNTALKSACCTALTEMSLDDSSALHILQENGVYVIAKLILPEEGGATAASQVLDTKISLKKKKNNNSQKLRCCFSVWQCYAFRTLRFLFSMERNRPLFKRLFPTDLFEMFIDVGHYVRDLAAYEELQTVVSLYTEEKLEGLREGIRSVDQSRPPVKVISGYSILDHLGTGAFGSVFKVQKQSGQNLLALKEVNLHNPAFGKDKRSRDSNVEKIISELTIIKEQMMHPNIVKYYKTFLEGDKLYIVMELIEGTSLAEHFTSLKEKQLQFTEDRIWNVFIQICLALRYLHKEKRIVHRDLTPNNIMLGEKDKVTITDFGLAKQKQENSKLTSVVGTIVYSCPEVVKNEPYGEKADIWALGCILYQMATLKPPFYSSNMLSLASKIVEAEYEPVEEGAFSERVPQMIRWCLAPDAERRPDVVAVSSRISDVMMRLMDGLYTSHNALERRAERDRKRAQKCFMGKQENPPVRADLLTPSSSVTCSSVHGEREINPDVESSSCVRPDENVATMDSCAKPRPASAGICVSQKMLRQIHDPIQKLLVQLHKVIFITQLPPSPSADIERRLVEKFKKSLFQLGSDPYNLKLVQASPELIEVSGATSDWWSMLHPPTRDPDTTDCTVDGYATDGVTYQQMQGIIEKLLEQNNYYKTTQNSWPAHVTW
ncbi:serine/threonine-protein kinase Nek10 isoform X3 [Oryzias latipes]|uniref:serine/threonine-protein kinase Nek10 isoform X3 n=1 Tax=Oryzias latipes TaxID=8090 RepID=UPI0009DA6D4C|nr:serine/threonine-protein kinase Nek10 isoform X3 [Oryzias latipes]